MANSECESRAVVGAASDRAFGRVDPAAKSTSSDGASASAVSVDRCCERAERCPCHGWQCPVHGHRDGGFSHDRAPATCAHCGSNDIIVRVSRAAVSCGAPPWQAHCRGCEDEGSPVSIGYCRADVVTEWNTAQEEYE